jgi:molybdenum cofactor cytidylyltransferase
MKSRKEGVAGFGPAYNGRMVASLILAAGRSSRMGRSKALLRQIQSGDTFVAHLVRVSSSAGLSPVFVVGRPEDVALRSVVDEAGASFVANADADQGQLSSLLAGLAAADGLPVSAVVVLPVDVPLVSTSVISALLTAALSPDVQIVRAAHGGTHGHPVLFKRSVFDELRSADPAVGARAVVRADPSRVRDVEVGDAGVTLDIDTPDDYLRAFGRRL